MRYRTQKFKYAQYIIDNKQVDVRRTYPVSYQNKMYCCGCGQLLNPSTFFCHSCGKQVLNLNSNFLPLTAGSTEKEIISHYFHHNFTYNAIIIFLVKYHDIQLSIRTLKRKFRSYGLRRRGNPSTSENIVKGIITNEIKGPSSMMGYRSMWNMLRSVYGIRYPRDKIMKFLKEIDPIGTAERKARKLNRRQFHSLGMGFNL